MARKQRRSSTGPGTSPTGLLGELTGLHTLPEADYFLGQDELTTLKVIRHNLFVSAIPVSRGPGESHLRQPERVLHPASVYFVQALVHYYHSSALHSGMLKQAAGFEDVAGCHLAGSVHPLLNRVAGPCGWRIRVQAAIGNWNKPWQWLGQP